MRVLFASSEAYPLAKTGGLGDVSAALPSALRSLGADVRLILPGYPQAVAAMVQASVCYATEDFAGFGKTRVISGHMPDTGLPVWLIDCPALFRRAGGLYQDGSGSDWADNALRFAFFSRAAAMLGCGKLAPNWRADVVHANDWHTALIPAYLHAADQDRPATVLTIHNLAFQGIFPASFWAKFGLPQSYFTPDGVEYYGQISFLKAGIQYSDRLTTVRVETH